MNKTQRWLPTALWASLIFTLIFAARYAMIDSILYEFRDDGIITMSVAKHMAEFGFVGVSPSGPIVDASSSPLQMLMAFVPFKLSEISYQAVQTAQTLFCTLIIGALAVQFFEAPRRTSLITISVLATALSFFFPFFLWHGSGMENGLTHTVFLASVLGLFLMVRDGRISWVWAPVVFLATIARVELVVHVALLLAFFSAYWLLQFRDLKGFLFAVSVGLLFILFHAARFVYFGDILPNTAYAQAISIPDRLGLLVQLDPNYVAAVWKNIQQLVILHGWWAAGLCFALVGRLPTARQMRFLLGLTAVLVVAGLLNAFLFGKARIDPPRTTTHVTLVLLVTLCAYFLSTLQSKKDRNRSILQMLLVFAIFQYTDKGTYYLGWNNIRFERNLATFEALAKENNIDRPLVSNPDLGVMTWHKSVNVLDIGRIGSPVMAKLADNEARANYLLNFAKPDFIESHGVWSARFCPVLFSTADFQAAYDIVGAPVNYDEFCAQRLPKKRFWVRRDVLLDSPSVERAFISKLQDNPDIDLVKNELSSCDGQCDYVMRTVYRMIPEFRQAGNIDAIVGLFASELHRAYLSGWQDPQAHRVLVDAFSQAEHASD